MHGCSIVLRPAVRQNITARDYMVEENCPMVTGKQREQGSISPSKTYLR
jgi:hypothetical protein